MNTNNQAKVLSSTSPKSSSISKSNFYHSNSNCFKNFFSVVSRMTLLLFVCYLYCVKESPSTSTPLINAFIPVHIQFYNRRIIVGGSERYKNLRKIPITAKKPRIISLSERGRNSSNEDERSNRNYDDDDQNDEDKVNVVRRVRNYLRERQIRKDAEILRREVNRREEERKQQLQRDAEELRLEVQRKEDERSRMLEEYKKKLAAKKKSDRKDKIQQRTSTKIRTTQIQTQTADPINRNPILNNNVKEVEDDEKASSKSRRIKEFVGSAQKAVYGVFDNLMKPEEWIVVAPKTRISPGEIVAVTAAGIDLLLIASKDGSSLHCVANSCPHLGTPLEVGTLERLPIESSDDTDDGGGGSDDDPKIIKDAAFFRENDISRMLKQDGCEDCIVCPLHKTAFALESGEVRGEWCPYPPVIGKLTGSIKKRSNLPIFDVRTKGKNIEVRLNTPVQIPVESSNTDAGND